MPLPLPDPLFPSAPVLLPFAAEPPLTFDSSPLEPQASATNVPNRIGATCPKRIRRSSEGGAEAAHRKHVLSTQLFNSDRSCANEATIPETRYSSRTSISLQPRLFTRSKVNHADFVSDDRTFSYSKTLSTRSDRGVINCSSSGCPAHGGLFAHRRRKDGYLFAFGATRAASGAGARAS